MTTAFKQRMVGAIFILSLGVILIPVILDKPRVEDSEHGVIAHDIPQAPQMPDVSEVSNIHYIFDDSPSVQTQTIAAAPEPLPDPIVTEVATPTSALPSAPTPETPIAAMDVTPPAAVAAAPESTRVASISVAHAKAAASLAQASQSEWTIQLGAFSSEKNAKALVEKLSDGGFSPYLRAMAQDSLVRVYVSPGISREQAADLVTKLDTEFGLKGIVVRYYQ